MLVPAKHINFSESLLGFGSYVLKNLDNPKTVDELWYKYQSDIEKKEYYSNHSFDNLMLTIIFLFSIGSIDEINGRIEKL